MSTTASNASAAAPAAAIATSVLIIERAAAAALLETGITHQIAVFINDRFLSFFILGRHLQAIDTLKLQIFGVVLYFVARLVYKWRCPQMLSAEESADKTSPRVFARTLERHGVQIPARDLANTVNHLLAHFGPSLQTQDPNRLERLRQSCERLGKAAEQDAAARAPAAALDAAEIAREFPDAPDEEVEEVGEELFNILYPRTRAMIHILLGISAVLAVLPILLRVFLVFVPRLAG